MKMKLTRMENDPGEPGFTVFEPGELSYFPTERFDGYLSAQPGRMWISAIISLQPGQGHLSTLMNDIWAAGYEIAVPNPFPHMEAILKAKGFTLEDGHPCDVWVKAAP